MNTAQPATRTALPFLEFTYRPFYMLLSRLVLLDEGNPAYPFIARKGRKILPYCQGRLIGSESFSQIRGQFVYDTG